MQEGEVASHVTRTPEAREDGAGRARERRGVVELPEDFIAAVRVEQEGLAPVGREGDVPGGPDRRRVGAGAWLDGNDALELAELVEDLHAIVLTIAHVHQAVIAEHDAVRMAAVAGPELPRAFARLTPLPQVAALLVEDGDAEVPVTVRDIDVAVGRIDRDVGGLVQQGAAAVQARATAGRRRGIADPLGADLQQQRLAVVRILLDDAVAVAGDPDVVLVIDEAAVETGRHRGELRGARVAEMVHDVAVAVEFDHRG